MKLKELFKALKYISVSFDIVTLGIDTLCKKEDVDYYTSMNIKVREKK